MAMRWAHPWRQEARIDCNARCIYQPTAIPHSCLPKARPMSETTYVLTLSCPNRPGIVAAVSTWLYQQGGDILDAQQFDDTLSNTFFMRVVFALDGAAQNGAAQDAAALQTGFAATAKSFVMRWSLRARGQKRRVMILVSKYDHCLADLSDPLFLL